jgi:hypothetical protein
VFRESAQFEQVLWAANTAAGAFLLVLVAVRRNYRAIPAFSFYLLVNLVVVISTFMLYRWWGLSSPSAWRVAWGMQALVICARALAVVEICRRVLSRYQGIWALAHRVLLVCAGLVLLYSGLAARHQWKLVMPSAQRGLELSMAAVIVVLLLFARYYEVQADPRDRSLAVGLCLYSCFCALNNTILERYLDQYVTIWNLLGMQAFLASQLLWTWALCKPQLEEVAEEELLPGGVYQSLEPQINLRLRSLNDHMYKIWRPEVPRH